MKKMNNRGFMLMETLIVATFLVTTLLFLYIQFNKVTKTYEDSFKYNTVNSLYATNNIVAYLKKEGMGKIAEKLNEQTYVDFTSCPKDFFKEERYCQVLLESLKVEKALFTKADLTNIKTNHKGLDQEMVSFINYLKDTSSQKYRLIVKYQDGTFASINLNFCTFTSNSVFVISEKNPTIPDCIINNTTCAAGTGVAIKVNDSKIYDFYVVSDDIEKNKLTLIMNKNLDQLKVAWVTYSGYKKAGGFNQTSFESYPCSMGPVDALDYLESQTSSWTNIPLETYELTDDNDGTPRYTSKIRTARARMITYTEATGLGCTRSSGNCPIWLVSNMVLENINNHSAYWTSSTGESTSTNPGNVYAIVGTNSGGILNIFNVFLDEKVGVRPVITISKSINTCS